MTKGTWKIVEYNGEPTPSPTASPPQIAGSSSSCSMATEYNVSGQEHDAVFSISHHDILDNPSRNRHGSNTENETDRTENSSILIHFHHAAFRILRSLRQFMMDLFLPVDYPHSVRSVYLEYQFYDSLQGLCSYLRGVVSTSAVLKAAGVGSTEATALGAAVTWALRDGIGMVGGLLFSYMASSSFDGHVKEFRLFADVINDVGLTLDMAAPMFAREHVLYVSALATVCKVMCGMAAGATKASITAHLALRGNMADLNAKESTQETLVNILGMIFGVALAKRLQHIENDNDESYSTVILWSIFLLLTAVHVWVNYVGVTLLHLPTLNRQRAEVVLQDVVALVGRVTLFDVQSQTKQSPPPMDDTGSKETKTNKTQSLVSVIPHPEQVSESLWCSTQSLLFRRGVYLGTSLKCFLGPSNSTLAKKRMSQFQRLATSTFQEERYVLCLGEQNRQGRIPPIYVLLRCACTEWDHLKAFLHVLVVQWCLRGKQEGRMKDGQEKEDDRNASLVKTSYQTLTRLFNGELSEIQPPNDANKDSPKVQYEPFSAETLASKGWDCDRFYLGFGPWRVDYKTKKE